MSNQIPGADCTLCSHLFSLMETHATRLPIVPNTDHIAWSSGPNVSYIKEVGLFACHGVRIFFFHNLPFR